MQEQTAPIGAQGRPSPQNTHSAEVNVLADHLGDLARELQATPDTEDMLAAVVTTALEMIPGAQEASLTVVTGRHKVEAKHPSSELPLQVDDIQNSIGQGPCLDAIYEQQTVRVPDMGREHRWPLFAKAATKLGVGSMLSFQLYVQGDNLGALNLYSRDTDAFGDESEQVGLVFASHAAVAFADAQKLDQMATSVRSRDVIGQAKGILMERYGIDEDRAFQVLRRYSQSSHRKLHDVAAELASQRQLPVLDRDPRNGGR